ncbi:Radical SAM domain protein [Kribbella flavida DSM 17836]|uniref:Radical SAM domain protein n=1 Tax=Kribbella flavida (strain DSM 17836 / JCM 10339 / NBRC 14399) TaxID=479435 RepID=D2PSV2_KRIFD|nr:Rv2578c family radical SAM protein [Kribbella flavida]ADB35004.1 Radical SAM domain protein [Kribbella flavida DSM 17836]
MRWAGQQLDAEAPGALPGLGSIAGLVRTVTTPEFQGITFHEVLARSALNSVPGSGMPFNWTVNPYRGCTHACRYCFARPTHRYLELDQGLDFDQQIVVKTNVAEVLRRELARPSWRGEQVALGTNTDPYQRAEGRYRLMPGIIEALASSGTPLSILTKGTLLRRDLELLQAAAEQVPVGIGVSLALADEELRRIVEPGVPSARGRLDLVRAVREAGLPCGVMVAPVLPWLTDSAEQLDHLFGELAAAGATGVTTLVLHLRPGVKDWFMSWLAQERPDLVKRYEALYAHGPNAAPSFRNAFEAKVRPLLTKHGFGGSRHRGSPSRRSVGNSGIRSSQGIVEAAGESSSGWGEPITRDTEPAEASITRFQGPARRSDPHPLRSGGSRRPRAAPVPPVAPDFDQQPLF